MTSSEYVQWLLAKGIQCKQEESCRGCAAFAACTREELVWPKGPADNNLSDEKLLELGLMGECDLGFKLQWKTWGIAAPVEVCPKPADVVQLLKCMAEDEKPIVLGIVTGILSGKYSYKNIWNCINDVREIIDILNFESPHVMEVTFIELQLAGLDAVLMNVAEILQIEKPKNFVLRDWNGSIGPCKNGSEANLQSLQCKKGEPLE